MHPYTEKRVEDFVRASSEARGGTHELLLPRPAERQLGPEAPPIWNLFNQDAWLGSIENDILTDVKAFREKVRNTFFAVHGPIPIAWYSDEFAARVLKAASNKHGSEGALNGGLLEVLKYEVARTEADILNDLLEAGKTEAYRSLLSEILAGRDVSAIEASLRGKKFVWTATSSGTSFQDDIRLAAVEADANGVMLHTVRKTQYDHAFESVIYECKSFDPSMSYSKSTGTVVHTVTEIYGRLVQEVINHGATGTINLEFVLNALPTDLYRGMVDVPQFMQAVLDLVQQKGFWEKDSAGHDIFVTELIVRPAGRSTQDPYAKVNLASTVVRFNAAGEYVTIEVAFYEMDTNTHLYKTTPTKVNGIVTWDNGPARSAYVTNWLFDRLQNQAWRNTLHAMVGL